MSDLKYIFVILLIRLIIEKNVFFGVRCVSLENSLLQTLSYRTIISLLHRRQRTVSTLTMSVYNMPFSKTMV